MEGRDHEKDFQLVPTVGRYLRKAALKRYEVSTVEIHLDSADNFSTKKNGSKASFKNDQRKWQETLKSCKVVKSTFMVRA